MMASGMSAQNVLRQDVELSCKHKEQSQEVPNQVVVPNIVENQDVYVKGSDTKQEDAGVTYTANAQLVDSLKAELEKTMNRFAGMVEEMLGKQGLKIAEGEGVWKTLAKGEFTVDEQTQEEAKQAISEEGYWGVKCTSIRIVDFAKALVGGDIARVEEMREAFIRGYQAAQEVWGGMMPEITQQTYDASMKLFDEWGAPEEETQEPEAPVEQTAGAEKSE